MRLLFVQEICIWGFYNLLIARRHTIKLLKCSTFFHKNIHSTMLHGPCSVYRHTHSHTHIMWIVHQFFPCSDCVMCTAYIINGLFWLLHPTPDGFWLKFPNNNKMVHFFSKTNETMINVNIPFFSLLEEKYLFDAYVYVFL